LLENGWWRQMRGKREVIGPKYAIRFSDLSGWHRIEVRCFSCERIHEFDPEGLKRLRLRHFSASTDAWLRMMRACVRRPRIGA
jgi:hypothetical protein